MPQLNKGGKFVFGLSEIGHKYTIQILDPAVHMYSIAKEDNIIIFTGGFCVTNKTLLSQSKLKYIIDDCTGLSHIHLIKASLFVTKDEDIHG